MVNRIILVIVALLVLMPSMAYWVIHLMNMANIHTSLSDFVRNMSDRYLILNLVLPFISYRINNLTIIRDQFGEANDMLINRFIYRASILFMIAGLGRLISTLSF